MVKFGINGWCWAVPFYDEKQFTHAIASARRIGYDGMEIPIEDPDKLNVKKLKRTLEEHEIIPCSFNSLGSGPDPISPDPNVRKKCLNNFKKDAEIAKELGMESGSVPLPPSKVSKLYSDLPYEKDWELAIEMLREIGDMAAQYDLYICIEPLNRFETYLINTVRQGVSLVKDVGHSHIKLMIDTFHMNIEESKFGSEILYAGDLIYHVHCNENNRAAPGTGHIPFKEVFSALKEIGYQRWLVIQTFTKTVQTMPRAAVIWRKLAPDQDTLARDGLKHMEYTWYTT